MPPKLSLVVEYPSRFFNEYEPKIMFIIGDRRCDTGHHYLTGVRNICSSDWDSPQELNQVVNALAKLDLPEVRVLLPS